MLQDIYPHQLKNNYTRCTPAADSLVFIYADGHFLLSSSKEPEANLPTYAELPDQLKAKTMQYLFMMDDKAVFSLILNKADFLSVGWKDCPVTVTIRNSPIWMPLVIITAFHLVRWYEKHKFSWQVWQNIGSQHNRKGIGMSRM